MNDSSASAGYVEWEWLPIAAVVGLCVVALVIVTVLYRRERRSVGPGVGRVILCLRVLLVVLLVVLVGGPVWVERDRVREPGVLLVVMDASRSFAHVDSHREFSQQFAEGQALGMLPEGTVPTPTELPERHRAAVDWIAGATRRELAARALSAARESLRSRFRLVPIAMVGGLRELSVAADGGWEWPASQGDRTNLSASLRRIAARWQSENLAGILVVTDGRHNAPVSPSETYDHLRELGVPVVLVGVGAEKPPTDAAVRAVDAPDEVFAGDEVLAQVSIDLYGFPPRPWRVDVREGDGDAVVHVATETPVASAESAAMTLRVPLRFVASQPGTRRYRVFIDAPEADLVPENNTREFSIYVRGEGVKVLLLDRPRWDARFLREIWSRDDNVTLAAWLNEFSQDVHLPDGFPRQRAELFDFDLLVIGDVPARLFSRAEREAWRDFVTVRGGAIVFLAGESSMPYGWADSPLGELFPVELIGPPPPLRFGAEIGRDGLPLRLTTEGEESPLTRLLPGKERNAELWELLLPHTWMSPMAGVRRGADVLATVGRAAAAKLPAATDAAVSGDAESAFLRERGAVLVTQSQGAGKVLYVGVDSTWRWRYRFGDELPHRFWSQVARWAVAGEPPPEPPPDLEALARSRNAAVLKELASRAGGTYLPLGRWNELQGLLPSRDRYRDHESRTDPWQFPVTVLLILAALLMGEWIVRKRADLM